MSALPKLADKKALRSLVPLNGLSAAHFNELAKKTEIQHIAAGKYIFKKGDRDSSAVYVLSGEVALMDGNDTKVTVEGGTDEAKHPIAPQQPRQLAARAKTRVTIIRVDSGLLDVMLAWDQSASYQVNDISGEEDEDWMSRMMQSELLQQLPAVNLQKLFISMQELPVKAGDTIVNQDEDGEYYYIIKHGTCIVSRKSSANGRPVKLAELHDGDSFGEESLLSGAKRNATVTMITDGVLMQLAKDDFDELLKAPLLSQISYKDAKKAIEDGSVVLDVRLPGEYANAHLKDSVNIPLAAIRNEAKLLDPAKTYIAYCDTGRRSTSAVFLLGQFGFDAHVLKGGLTSVPPEDCESNAGLTEAQSAEILNFNRDGDPLAQVNPAELESLQAEESKAREQVGALRQETEALTNKFNEIQAKLAEQENKFRNLQKQEQDKTRALAELEKKFATGSSLAEEINKLKGALEEAQATVAKQAEQITQAHDAGEMSNEELKEIKGELERVQKDLYETTARSTEADQVIKQSQFELNRLQMENELLNQKLEEAEDIEQQLQEMRASSDALSAENAGLAEKVANLERERERLANDADGSTRTLSEELEKLRAQLQEMQASSDALSAENTSLAEKVSNLERERDQLANDADGNTRTLNEELEKLRAQLQEMHASSDALSAENTGLAEKLANLDREREQLASDADGNIRTLNEELEKLRAQLQEQLDRYEQVMRDLQARDENNRKLQDEINQLSHTDNELQQQVTSLNQQLSEAKDQEEKARLAEDAVQQEVIKLRSQAEAEVKRAAIQINNLEQDLQHHRTYAEEEAARVTAQISSLEQQLQEKDQTRQQLDRDLREQHESAIRMQTELSLAKEQIANLEKSEQSIRNELGLVQQREKEIKALEEQLRGDLQSSQKSYEEKLRSLREETQTLQQQLQDSNLKQVDLEAALENTAAREASLRTELENALDTHKSEVAERDDQVRELQQQLNDNAEKRQRLLDDLQMSQEQEQGLQQEVSRLRQAELEARQARARVEQEFENLKKQTPASQAETDEQLQALQEELRANKAEQLQLQQSLEQQLQKFEDIKVENEGLKQENQTKLQYLREEMDALRLERDRMSQAKAKDAEVQRELKTQLDLAQQEFRQLQLEQQGRDQQISKLQKQLESTSTGLGDTKGAYDALLEEKQALLNELNLVREEFEHTMRESAKRIQDLEEKLSGKEREQDEVRKKVEQEISHRSDAESAFRVMEGELDSLRQEAEELRLTLQKERDTRADFANQIKKLEQQRQDEVKSIEATRVAEFEAAQKRTVELEIQLKKIQKTAEDATNKATRLQMELNASSQSGAHTAKLERQIEDLKRDMEGQLDRYKTEVDDESEKLRQENTQMRKELERLYKDYEVAVQTGRPVSVEEMGGQAGAAGTATSHAKTGKSEQDSSLFDLPDIDKNLFHNVDSRQKKGIGLGTLMVMVILFGALSAGGMYWFLMQSGDESAQGSAIQPEKSSSGDTGQNPVPLETAPKARPAVPKISAEDRKASPAAKATVSTAVVKPRVEKTAAVATVTDTVMKPIRTYRDFLKDGGAGPIMIEVPGGIFEMGSPKNSPYFEERPQHKVSLQRYSISKHEVTFSEYDRFAEATGRKKPSDNGWGRDNHPVVNVSWEDARAYAKWLSEQTGYRYRLPTEAEWEYAARAGTSTQYWWGNNLIPGRSNCFTCGSKWDRVSTAPVGSFKANSLGLQDVSGNVMEWTADCYFKNYEGAPIDGSAWVGDKCASRVVRGGSYRSTDENIRMTKRSDFVPETAVDEIGIRLVRE